jgi:hypothetical protein
VDYQLRFVLGQPTRRKQFEALNSIPSDLTELYGKTIVQLERKGIDAMKSAFGVLSWILHSFRPLYMTELCEAILTEVGDSDLMEKWISPAKELVELCDGFIFFDEASGIVGFSHSTVAVFLKSERFSSLLLSHVDLAKICLTYINFNVFDEGPCTDQETFNCRLQRYRMGNYAALGWEIYSHGDGEDCVEVRDAIFNLLRNRKKLLAMLQLRWFRVGEGFDISTIGDVTPLHVVSEAGLAKIAKFLLQNHLKMVC